MREVRGVAMAIEAFFTNGSVRENKDWKGAQRNVRLRLGNVERRLSKEELGNEMAS